MNELMMSPVADLLGTGSGRLLIGADWVEAASSETFDTVNPATGEVIAACAAGDREDIDRAVAAARRALDGPWSRMTPAERSNVLWRIADLIERDADQLAALETIDNGKPYGFAQQFDLPGTIEHFRYYAGWPTKIEGETIPVSAPGEFLNYTVREPIGVVGAIVPWNYPLLMAALKVAPALACGNTCVLKPAEQTPLTALWLGRVALEAGLPAGVLNIVTGYGATAGASLSSHDGVDALVFTGSTEVGREIVRASAGNLKRIALELGGKSPNLICADADLDEAVPGSADGIFLNMGQNCSAGSRIFAQSAVYEEVVDGLADRAEAMTLGNGFDAGVDLGPVVSDEQLSRVMTYVDAGQRDGARVAAGGSRPENGALKDGYFIRPTVLSEVSNDMRVAREEIFGPVVTVIRFDDLDGALRSANDTPYGLGAGIWTKDVSRAHRAARDLRAGSVWVNCYDITDAASPFGGFKASGYGRDMGHHALESYTQTKSVWVKYG